MANEMQNRCNVQHTDDEWHELLTPEQYRILRQAGTEPAFENAYWNNHDDGDYRCAACRSVLYDSRDKYDSGTGWPSFVRPVDPTAVESKVDSNLAMVRTEIRCSCCHSHLGHVFDDGPAPTHQRYCMNSGAMEFVPRHT